MAKYIHADLTDMVFEGRERAYGAYLLRKRYPYRLLTATALGLGLFFAGITAPNLTSSTGPDNSHNPKERVIILDPASLVDPVQKESDPVIPRIKRRKPPRTLAFRVPEPKPEDEIRDPEPTLPSMDSLANAPNLGLSNIAGTDEVLIDIPDDGPSGGSSVIEDGPSEKRPGIGDFVMVSQVPKPVNLDDIKSQIEFPELARENNFTGEVLVRILIDTDGRYVDHRFIKKAHPILASAVEPHLSKLVFTPALQGDRAVMFWINLPFHFKTL